MRISDLSSDVCSSYLDDVAVAGHPAHVGGAPEDVVFLEVEHRLVGVGAEHQVAARGVQHALGLAGGPGGVEDEQRSEERRLGRECVSTCRSRWSPYH